MADDKKDDAGAVIGGVIVLGLAAAAVCGIAKAIIGSGEEKPVRATSEHLAHQERERRQNEEYWKKRNARIEEVRASGDEICESCLTVNPNYCRNCGRCVWCQNTGDSGNVCCHCATDD